MEEVLVSSEEVVDVLVRHYCSSSTDFILVKAPSCGLYSLCAHGRGVEVQEIAVVPKDTQLRRVRACGAVDQCCITDIT
jgi:hypothetical protein